MSKRKHKVEELPKLLGAEVAELPRRVAEMGDPIADFARRVAELGDPIAEMYRRFAEENGA